MQNLFLNIKTNDESKIVKIKDILSQNGIFKFEEMAYLKNTVIMIPSFLVSKKLLKEMESVSNEMYEEQALNDGYTFYSKHMFGAYPEKNFIIEKSNAANIEQYWFDYKATIDITSDVYKNFDTISNKTEEAYRENMRAFIERFFETKESYILSFVSNIAHELNKNFTFYGNIRKTELFEEIKSTDAEIKNEHAHYVYSIADDILTFNKNKELILEKIKEKIEEKLTDEVLRHVPNFIYDVKMISNYNNNISNNIYMMNESVDSSIIFGDRKDLIKRMIEDYSGLLFAHNLKANLNLLHTHRIKLEEDPVVKSKKKSKIY